MKSFTREQLTVQMKAHRVSRRLMRELRYTPDAIDMWPILDMLAITTRSMSEGLLVIQTTHTYLIPYELTAGPSNSKTGQTKPAICDFCFTWQQGGRSRRITFTRASDGHTITFICCADLRCSLHVRNMTPEATLSRTQLREDLTTTQRTARLQEKLTKLAATLDVSAAAEF